MGYRTAQSVNRERTLWGKVRDTVLAEEERDQHKLDRKIERETWEFYPIVLDPLVPAGVSA